MCSIFDFNSIKVTVAHPNFHPHHSFLVGWLSWLVGHNLMIILLFCRSLKKYWCKTSYLDSLQASQNLMNKFQDGDSSSQLCHTSCTVHLLCCNIGEIFFLERAFFSFTTLSKSWNIFSMKTSWMQDPRYKHEYLDKLTKTMKN